MIGPGRTIALGPFINGSGGTWQLDGRTLELHAGYNWPGTRNFLSSINGASIENLGGVFNIEVGAAFAGDGGGSVGGEPFFNAATVLMHRHPVFDVKSQIGGTFVNAATGIVEVQAGRLNVGVGGDGEFQSLRITRLTNLVPLAGGGHELRVGTYKVGTADPADATGAVGNALLVLQDSGERGANIRINFAVIEIHGQNSFIASAIVFPPGFPPGGIPVDALANFATNNGTFVIRNDRDFTTTGGFTNNGTVVIGTPGSAAVVPPGDALRTRFTVAGNYTQIGTTLIHPDGELFLTPGNTFVILNNDGTDAIVGTFAGLPEGDTFTVGGMPFVITYVGGDGNDVVLTANPNQPTTASANGPYTVGEGANVTLTGSGNDPDNDPLAFAWDLDNNGTFETPGQNPTFSADGRDGPSSQTVVLQVCDDKNACATATATVNIVNVAPTVGAITAPLDPNAVGTSITASAPFTDAGVLDSHTAVLDWGDNTTSPGTVTETNGSGSVTGAHTYTAAGVYTVTLTVTDKDGDSGKSVFQFVVVYDPSAGFVTGAAGSTRPKELTRPTRP